MVDTADLKSVALNRREGSSPSLGTFVGCGSFLPAGRCCSQVVRQRSAKPLYVGAIPTNTFHLVR